jgi:G3E family GTPase
MIADIIFGFLGSGKTTFISRVLRGWGDKEKIVVLVNEFGEVGIDGTLLQGRGGDVVEMPSGCICCTLQTDFRTQILEILQTIRPQRLIVEPTGVATIRQVHSILSAQLFEDYLDTIHNVLIADATGFMGLYKANPHFMESQVRNAHVVLLNKCDRVERRRALLTRDAITAINPDATVLMTEFGLVDWGQYQLALSSPLGPRSQQTESVTNLQSPIHLEAQGSAPIHVHEEQDALGYESFGLVFDDLRFDLRALDDLFTRLNGSAMGEIVRAKGLFRVENKWVLMELASGERSFQPVLNADRSKVSIIGRGLKRKEIGIALEQCVTVENPPSPDPPV